MVRTPALPRSPLQLIAAAPGEMARVRYVTDGDALRLPSGEGIRVAGINVPETHADQARCRAETVRSKAAAAPAWATFDGRDDRASWPALHHLHGREYQ